MLIVPADSLRNGRAVVEADGHAILLIRVDDEVHAFANACPHEGNPLVEGELLGDTLECAYHGWRFDLSTGSCLVGTRPARRYAAVLDGDVIRVQLED